MGAVIATDAPERAEDEVDGGASLHEAQSRWRVFTRSDSVFALFLSPFVRQLVKSSGTKLL